MGKSAVARWRSGCYPFNGASLIGSIMGGVLQGVDHASTDGVRIYNTVLIRCMVIAVTTSAFDIIHLRAKWLTKF